MKIFLDTANIEEISKYSFIIDGVTTNPTLLAQEKTSGDIRDQISRITKIINGPVSVEAVSRTAPELIQEAKDLAALSENVVVKIAMTEEGLKATKKLSAEGINTNVTLIFSATQACLAAKAGATYASIFIGRLDDIGHDGLSVVQETLEIFRQYNVKTQVITASVRHPIHVINAAKAGCHVITIPPKVLSLMFKHNLTDSGITRFLDDWAQIKHKSGKRLK